MKRYLLITYSTQSDDGHDYDPIDKESFQKAVNFPLWIAAHCQVDAFGIRFDGKFFKIAYIYVHVVSDTFMDRRGIFAWKEFHRVVEKIEQQVKQYGFRIADPPSWRNNTISLDCWESGFRNNIYYPNGEPMSY